MKCFYCEIGNDEKSSKIRTVLEGFFFQWNLCQGRRTFLIIRTTKKSDLEWMLSVICYRYCIIEGGEDIEWMNDKVYPR